MEPLPVHNRSRWGETERMELSPTTRRRQFSSAITAPAKTILAIMALFRVSLESDLWELRVQNCGFAYDQVCFRGYRRAN